MYRKQSLALALLTWTASACPSWADDDKDWGTIKGQVVYDGKPAPVQGPIAAVATSPDRKVCIKDGGLKTEEWIVNPKNLGVKNVFVWLAPDVPNRAAPFPADKIHPSLVKLKTDVIVIEQPCCRFIPRAVVARAGQELQVSSSPFIAHNAKFESANNGAGNTTIPLGVPPVTLVKKLVAEPGQIQIACSIHPWMKMNLRVFDHPYAVVTDEDGKFEMPLAPVGKFRIYYNMDGNGWKDGVNGRMGEIINVQPKLTDLGQIKYKENK